MTPGSAAHLQATPPGCALCGNTPTDAAHVKPRAAFDETEQARGYDRDFNIVHLCPTHHRQFDAGRIALCECHEEAFIATSDGTTTRVPIETSIIVKPEYLVWRNERSVITIEQCDRACRP